MAKNAKLIDLIEEVNRRNRESTCPSDVRVGWNSLLEHFLNQKGVYSGFGYLKQDEVPEGEKPGIIPGETMKENVFPDESRRIYYVHAKLRKK